VTVMELSILNFAQDGKMILCASDDKTLKLYCTSSGACLSTLHGHTAGVQSCCFSPDGSTILSGGKDTKLILWDVNGKLRKTFVGHSNVVKKCCFSPDGNTFIADFRRTIKVFDATTVTFCIVFLSRLHLHHHLPFSLCLGIRDRFCILWKAIFPTMAALVSRLMEH